MTETLRCPDCEADRTGPGRCRCGSFAAPAAPSPPPGSSAVSTADKQWIARAIRDGVGLGAICRELDRDAATVRAAHAAHQGSGKRTHIAHAPSDNGSGVYRRRACAKCGGRFTTTPRRRVCVHRMFFNRRRFRIRSWRRAATLAICKFCIGDGGGGQLGPPPLRVTRRLGEEEVVSAAAGLDE